MGSKRLNPKRSNRSEKAKLLIMSGGKLAEPSAPLSLRAAQFLEEQFGLERSRSAALFLELGWIDKRGNVVGDYAPDELLEMQFDPAYVRPLTLLDQIGPVAMKLGMRRVE